NGLPTTTLLDLLGRKADLPPPPGGGMGGGFGLVPAVPSESAFRRVGHCLWCVVAAIVGGTVSRMLFGAAAPSSAESAPDERSPRRWRIRAPAVVAVGGLALAFILLNRALPSGVGAGLTFMLTSALLGLALVGAACAPGRSRHIWLGIALFGIGYMVLAFGRSLDDDLRPNLPTDYLLEAL